MKEVYFESLSNEIIIGKDCFKGTLVDFNKYSKLEDDIEMFTMKIKNLRFSNNEVFSTFYDNDKFVNKEGCIYTNDIRRLIDVERNIKEVKVNQKCQIISNFAFNIKSLKKVTFDNDCELQKISDFAFSESQIKSIKIPSTVNAIEIGAFYKCTNLATVNIPPLIEELDISLFHIQI